MTQRIRLNTQILWATCFCALILAVTVLTKSVAPIDDWAVFEYIGQHVVHGSKLYSDIWDNKLPAVYYLYAVLNALAFKNYALHHLALLCIVISSSISFALLSKKISIRRWQLSTCLYFLMIALPQFNYSATEYPAAALTNAAILAAVGGAPILAALLAVCACQFWLPSAITLLAVAFVFSSKQRVTYIAGCVLAMFAVVCTYIALLGPEQISALTLSWANYIHAGSSVQSLQETVHLFREGVMSSGILLVFIVPVLLGKREWNKTDTALAIWISCALIGTLVTRRFYSHYFIEAYAPGVLLTFRAFEDQAQRRFARMRMLLSAVLVVAFAVSMLRAVQRNHKYTQKTVQEANEISASLLKAASPHDTLWIVGAYAPQIYLESGLELYTPQSLVDQALIAPDKLSKQDISFAVRKAPDLLATYGNIRIPQDGTRPYAVIATHNEWSLLHVK